VCLCDNKVKQICLLAGVFDVAKISLELLIEQQQQMAMTSDEIRHFKQERLGHNIYGTVG